MKWKKKDIHINGKKKKDENGFYFMTDCHTPTLDRFTSNVFPVNFRPIHSVLQTFVGIRVKKSLSDNYYETLSVCFNSQICCKVEL